MILQLHTHICYRQKMFLPEYLLDVVHIFPSNPTIFDLQMDTYMTSTQGLF